MIANIIAFYGNEPEVGDSIGSTGGTVPRHKATNTTLDYLVLYWYYLQLEAPRPRPPSCSLHHIHVDLAFGRIHDQAHVAPIHARVRPPLPSPSCPRRPHIKSQHQHGTARQDLVHGKESARAEVGAAAEAPKGPRVVLALAREPVCVEGVDIVSPRLAIEVVQPVRHEDERTLLQHVPVIKHGVFDYNSCARARSVVSQRFVEDRLEDRHVPDLADVDLVLPRAIFHFRRRYKRRDRLLHLFQNGRVGQDMVQCPEGRGNGVGEDRMAPNCIKTRLVLNREPVLRCHLPALLYVGCRALYTVRSMVFLKCFDHLRPSFIRGRCCHLGQRIGDEPNGVIL